MSGQPPIFDQRFIADIVIEAKTPLKIGSGDSHIAQDSPIARDANGLPCIPGTALAGVLRAELKQQLGAQDWIAAVFGNGGDDGRGSRLIVSTARILDQDGKPADGLRTQATIDDDPILSQLRQLPIRDHVRIGHRGSADTEGHGKFDEEILYKGVRFALRLELVGSIEDAEIWGKIIQTLGSPLFRLGGGTRRGFGRLSVIGLDSRRLDLRINDDREKFLNQPSLLEAPTKIVTERQAEQVGSQHAVWSRYLLSLKAEDWYLFGSGHSDAEADLTPVLERTIVWNDGKASFSELLTIVPASSIKGAISHRVALHFNRLSKCWADAALDMQAVCGENNKAVAALFGSAKKSEPAAKGGEGGIRANAAMANSGAPMLASRGRVLIDDLALSFNNDTIIPHISLDRFTQGPMQGALFFERVSRSEKGLNLAIVVENSALAVPGVKEAFEATLTDLCTGMLPLGGGTMRGNGAFTGTWEAEGVRNG